MYLCCVASSVWPSFYLFQVFLFFERCALTASEVNAPCFLPSVSVSRPSCFWDFFINAVYPVLGITQPLTTLPVIGTMSAVTVLLAAVSYWRDRDFVGDVTTDLNRVLIPPILLLCIIPFIMVLAVYAMNAYHTNIPLL